MLRKRRGSDPNWDTLCPTVGSDPQIRMLMIILISLMMFLTGCTTLPTSKTSFSDPSVPADLPIVDARDLLELAIKTTHEAEEAQSFWYNGHIKNGIQNRTTTSMFEGVVMRPEQAYIVNGRIAAQPFQYYSWGDTKFIRRDDIWYRTEEEGVLPFDPFAGFMDWLPLLEDAKQLPDQTVLSGLSHVIEVRIPASEWIQRSTSAEFENIRQQLQAEPDSAIEHILENTTVKMTIWIGKSDHLIYQYQTWIILPLPGAGYVDQETFFRFFRFSDPSIPTHIQSPDRVERWVLEYEEMLKSGELVGEMEQ